MNEEVRFLRLPEVMKRVGYKRTRLYDLMKDGRFPEPVSLGARAIAWLSSDIENWMTERISERDQTSKIK